MSQNPSSPPDNQNPLDVLASSSSASSPDPTNLAQDDLLKAAQDLSQQATNPQTDPHPSPIDPSSPQTPNLSQPATALDQPTTPPASISPDPAPALPKVPDFTLAEHPITPSQPPITPPSEPSPPPPPTPPSELPQPQPTPQIPQSPQSSETPPNPSVLENPTSAQPLPPDQRQKVEAKAQTIIKDKTVGNPPQTKKPIKPTVKIAGGLAALALVITGTLLGTGAVQIPGMGSIGSRATGDGSYVRIMPVFINGQVQPTINPDSINNTAFVSSVEYRPNGNPLEQIKTQDIWINHQGDYADQPRGIIRWSSSKEDLIARSENPRGEPIQCTCGNAGQCAPAQGWAVIDDSLNAGSEYLTKLSSCETWSNAAQSTGDGSANHVVMWYVVIDSRWVNDGPYELNDVSIYAQNVSGLVADWQNTPDLFSIYRSPIQSLVCVDLETTNSSPAIGDTLTFTCNATAQNLAITTYEFRYQIDAGSWIDLTQTNTSATQSLPLNVSTPGNYLVQCRACTVDSLCTPWSITP